MWILILVPVDPDQRALYTDYEQIRFEPDVDLNLKVNLMSGTAQGYVVNFISRLQ